MIARIFLAGLGISIGASCGFDGNTGEADNDPPSGGSPRCKFTYVDVCARPLGPPIVYQRDATIDTSGDGVCTHVIPQGAGRPELCVLHGPSVAIAADVTIRAIGNRPLVLVSSGAIDINGRLDVSGTRPENSVLEVVGAGGEAMPCAAFVTSPDSDSNGGDGGAGASFGGVGGKGAAAPESDGLAGDTGDTGDTGDAGKLAEFDIVRAGCRGQPGGGSGNGGSGNGSGGGTGGAPGGAVYLAAAGEITIARTGSVAANGGGGGGGAPLAGGGGGGSGGWITMEGAAIHLFGKVTSNGGGGGEGGTRVNKNASPGAPGENGRIENTAAAGGDSPMVPGRGGNGSAGSQHNGGAAVATNSSPSAGSGGGGGAGYLRLLGQVDGDGLLSPSVP